MIQSELLEDLRLEWHMRALPKKRGFCGLKPLMIKEKIEVMKYYFLSMKSVGIMHVFICLKKCKASEFYVKDQPTKAPHIQCVFNNGIKADLIRNLHEHVYNVFRESTCFGNYMQMHGCCARGQIHRCCMALELNCSSRQAFVMRVNGSTLRFTLREFALISGLNCVSEEKDFIFDTTEPNRLMEQYFQGVKLIRKVDIMESFEAKVWGDNDQDGLKFVILFFIQTVIFAGERVTKKVPRLHFDLVESGMYSQFPWGKKSFYLLMKSLSKKMDREKQFYRIGGMPIVIQVWLYECSSSIDFQVAQKVDDHIPRLLNWQTAKEIPRYKKLMKTIFSDVNNKFKFRNITPNQRELAVLQLPPEGIENQGEVQYDEPDEVISHCKDSDDDFQEHPPQTVKVKRKGKVGSSPSPVKKRKKKQLTDGSNQVAQKLEPRVVVKLPVKKDIVSKKVPKKPKVVLKQTESVSTDQTNTTSKDSDIPRASGSEVQVWLKELSDFRKEVKQEFVDIRKLINDNFKTVLTAINSKQNEQEVRHSDDPIVPPNLNDEERYRSPYTSIPEVISNQVQVVQGDKLGSGNLEVLVVFVLVATFINLVQYESIYLLFYQTVFRNIIMVYFTQFEFINLL
ncbi:hypothetical protein AABB24_003806 [Solanum stoloniferum]|uniref:DUF1985 domain-containing protein n=1 Tax=Solanum stoloniferum TaxID=62892 RepID=A0ABD2VA03_9SOLN